MYIFLARAYCYYYHSKFLHFFSFARKEAITFGLTRKYGDTNCCAFIILSGSFLLVWPSDFRQRKLYTRDSFLFIYFFLFHKEAQSASFFFHFDKRCMKFLPYYAPTFLWLVWFFLTPRISFCSRQKLKMMEEGSLNEIILIFF